MAKESILIFTHFPGAKPAIFVSIITAILNVLIIESVVIFNSSNCILKIEDLVHLSHQLFETEKPNWEFAHEDG